MTDEYAKMIRRWRPKTAEVKQGWSWDVDSASGRCSFNEPDTTEIDVLNALAEDGWEVVSHTEVEPPGGQQFFFLKRERPS